jgi:hypothetical protein
LKVEIDQKLRSKKAQRRLALLLLISIKREKRMKLEQKRTIERFYLHESVG